MISTTENATGYQVRNLGEFLTEKQFKKALKIMDKPGFHQALTTYLESIQPSLESKGMLPAFLAYWLEWARVEGKL